MIRYGWRITNSRAAFLLAACGRTITAIDSSFSMTYCLASPESRRNQGLRQLDQRSDPSNSWATLICLRSNYQVPPVSKPERHTTFSPLKRRALNWEKRLQRTIAWKHEFQRTRNRRTQRLI